MKRYIGLLLGFVFIFILSCKHNNSSKTINVAKDTIDTGNYYTNFYLTDGPTGKIKRRPDSSSYYEIIPVSEKLNKIIHYSEGKIGKTYLESKNDKTNYYYLVPYDDDDSCHCIPIPFFIYYIRYDSNLISKFTIDPNDGIPIHFGKVTYKDSTITETTGRLKLSSTFDFKKRGAELFELLQKDSLKYLMYNLKNHMYNTKKEIIESDMRTIKEIEL